MSDTNKSLIENSDYLKRLSLELKKKDLKEIDSNLLYEVAYANTYLDVLLSKSNNASLNTELLDIKSVFDTILASASYEEVSKLKGSFDYKKLLKCKYGDVDKASYERSYAVSGSANAVAMYLKNRVLTLVMMGVLLTIVGISGIFTFDFLPSTVKPLMTVMHILMHILVVALFLVKFVSFGVDLLYLVVPAFTYLVDSKRYVSSYARKSMEVCCGDTVVYKKVKDFDRIERNKVWLETMLGVESILVDYPELLSELKSLDSHLKELEEKGKKNKEYYLSIAKIEFLHDKYLDLVAD